MTLLDKWRNVTFWSTFLFRMLSKINFGLSDIPTVLKSLIALTYAWVDIKPLAHIGIDKTSYRALRLLCSQW